MTPHGQRRIEYTILGLSGVIVGFGDRLVHGRIAQRCSKPPDAAQQTLNRVCVVDRTPT